MRRVVLIFFAVWVVLQIVNILSHYLIFDRTSYEPILGLKVPLHGAILPWFNFDGKNYLEIAISGYENKVLAVFFPMYPLLVRIFSLNLILNPILVGLAISYTCAFLTIIFLYKLLEKKYNEKVATRSLLLLLLFPSSFYLFAYYTESLFLLFAVLTFWFIDNKKMFLASLIVALATATRLMGLALVVVIFYEGLKFFRNQRKLPWWVMVAPLGILAFMTYSWWQFSDPFLMISNQTDPRFGRTLSFLGPILIFKDALTKVIVGPLVSYDSPFVYQVIVIEFLMAVYGVFLLVFSFKKLPSNYFIYLIASIAIIFWGSALSSIARYLLVIFPMYIYLALHLPKNIRVVWGVISFLLLVFSSSLFLRNYWIA